MKEYREFVSEKAFKKSTELIPCGGIEHAEVLVSSLFKGAKKIVQVFTGSLNELIYATDTVLASAKLFLSNKDSKLEILIQEGNELSYSNRLIKLCEKHPDQCKIKYSSGYAAKLETHFMVADNFAYRLKPYRKKPAAVGCFNDADSSNELSSFFDDIFNNNSKPAI